MDIKGKQIKDGSISLLKLDDKGGQNFLLKSNSMLGITDAPVNNLDLTNKQYVDSELSNKQNVLNAGQNITISSNVISATDTTYTSGTLSKLNTGTDTTNSVWSAKILSDWMVDSDIYVNIVKYGCVGDNNTNNKDNFISAVNDAVSNKKPLYIPKGKFLLSDVDKIDLTGIPKILCDGELIIEANDSNLGRWEPVFVFSGDKELVGNNISIEINDYSLNINNGKSIKKGDTIFIISSENIDEGRPNDYKGQRMTVKSYNPIDGHIVFFEKFYFNINSAHVYHNNNNPKIEIEGLNMTCTNEKFRVGLSILYSTAYIKNVRINGFKYAGLNIGSSYSVIRGYESTDTYLTGTNTSYGINFGDLSLSYSYNLNVSGGRHAIAHGGGQSFTKFDLGIISSDFARFGCISYIYDSNISSQEENSLDAHMITKKVNIYNSIINGGITAKNYLFDIYNCQINLLGTYGRIYINSGIYGIYNSIINSYSTTIFKLTDNIVEFKIKNTKIITNPINSTLNTFDYGSYFINDLIFNNVEFYEDSSSSPIRRLNIDNVKNVNIKGLIMTNSIGIDIGKYIDRQFISLDDMLFNSGGQSIRIRDESVPISIKNSISRNPDGFGAVRIDNCKNAIISNLEIVNSSGRGINLVNAENVIISNSNFENNNNTDITVNATNCVVSNCILYDHYLTPSNNHKISSSIINGSIVG